MGIVNRLVSYDEIYNKTTTSKTIVNHIDILDIEQRELIKTLMVSNFDQNNISTIPTCECGATKGGFYIGEKCEICHTEVTTVDNKGLNYLLWAKRPEGVERFMNVYIFHMLDEITIKHPQGSFSPVRWIVDPKYRRTVEISEDLEEYIRETFRKNGIELSYNGLVSHLDFCLDFISSIDGYGNKQQIIKRQQFFEFVKRNKHKILNEYLPFPNKTMIVYESSELGRFMDKSLIKSISAMRRLTGIDIKHLSPQAKQARVVATLYELASFYKEYIKTKIFTKTGLIRQHLISTRSHFTCRAVITLLTDHHAYDEIHLPWVVAISLFREHIINKLYRRGYNYRETNDLLSRSSVNYHPVIDEIFRELIAESGDGIRVFFNRNPSLGRGSILTVRVTKIKTNLRDNTISMSVLITPSMNADFDGDELNVTLISGVNDIVRAEMHNFEPHNNILSLTGENDFSSNIKMPKPVVGLLSNWMMKED